jgi:hypothetical protein
MCVGNNGRHGNSACAPSCRHPYVAIRCHRCFSKAMAKIVRGCKTKIAGSVRVTGR